jgi:N-acetyl-gamma-glutamyl-phosphate reductase common form
MVDSSPAKVAQVGIVGGSGYTGGELLRLLLRHPRAKLKWVTSRGDRELERVHRNLLGSGIEFCREDEADRCDVVFLCVPATAAMNYARRFLKANSCVVDMSADFRLRDQATYERVYRSEHSAFELMKEAVFGIPELYREELRGAKLIANPGCFAITTILGLAPLVKGHPDEIELDRLVVDGCSGSSGAGAQPIGLIHHSEIATSIQPYNVVDHRHTYEMEQELSRIAGQAVTVHFTPSHGPFVRGIHVTAHVFFRHPPDRHDMLEAVRAFYQDEPFIRVLSFEKESAAYAYEPYPSCAEVQGSNYCHIGLDVDPARGRVVVFSATDNLMKGAAGNAVQCMNLALGLPETCGLEGWGLHP